MRDQITVDLPVDRVFDFFADPRNLVGLDPALSTNVALIAGDSAGSGSVYRISYSMKQFSGVFLVAYTTVERPRRVRAEFRKEDGGSSGWTSYEMAPNGSSTIVQLESEAQVGIVHRAAAMLVYPYLRWSVKRGNRLLARRIEAWSTRMSRADAD